MKQRIIKHPLRDIVLEYDETIPETDTEKRLIEAYIAMHDQWVDVVAPCGKLIYEYKELEYKADDIIKIFSPIEDKINLLHREAEAVLLYNREAIMELEIKYINFHPNINAFHDTYIIPLTKEQNKLDEVLFELEDKQQQLCMKETEFSSIQTEGYNNSEYKNYSLNTRSLNEDDEHFREVLTKINILYKTREKELVVYNSLMNITAKAYATMEETKKIISIGLNDTGDMDSTLSDSFAASNGDETKKPFYLYEPGDKKIESFKINYALLAHSTSRFLTLGVNADTLMEMNPGNIEHLIFCLQHFPKLIEKMIFSLDIRFEENDGTEIPKEEWRGREPYIKFLSILNRLPCSVFFFSDRDIRSYILLGSLISEHKGTQVDEKTMAFEGENLEELCNRIYTACWFMMVYCHNTGFDPKTYIETLLDELDLPMVTYELVKENFDADLIKGIHIKAVPIVKDKENEEEEE